MARIRITSGEFTFIGELDEEKSPKTCEWFLGMLPFRDTMIHVSWSGQASFIQLGDRGYGVPFENPTSRPAKGEVMVYPGNIPHLQMGGEIFLAWGGCVLACANGNLAGNRLMTIVEGKELLERFGRAIHLKGGREVLFEKMND